MLKDGKMTRTPIALFVAMLLTPVISSAAVVVYTDDTALRQNKQQQQFFSQSGLSGEQSEVIIGAGEQRPLTHVTDIIIPKNWKIEKSGNFDMATVSWTGGLVWPQILRDIAQREGIFISLDWVTKVAAIHVPGERAQMAQMNEAAIKSKTDQQNANVKSEIAQQSERREQAVVKANNDRAQLDLLLTRTKDAQKSNQEFIDKLNENNRKFESDNSTLKELLEKERAEKAKLEEKYAVITPGVTQSDSPKDATALFRDHKERSVLPFDPSFEYFIKGGHADVITPDTPATYLAKVGTVEAVVMAWCEEIGCKVEYRSGVQHYNNYEIELKGNFYQASRELVSIFKNSDRPLNIEFWPDVRVGNGKKGLVVISDLNFSKPQ